MSRPSRTISLRWLLAGIFAVSLILAGFVSRFADTDPDGLNKVAGKLGFASSETPHHIDNSPFAGYQGDFAGVIGVLLVLLIAGGLTWMLRHRSAGDDG